MATKKAAKTAKKASQPVKKTPAKKAAVKPVSKVAKKVEPVKAPSKKAAAPVKKAAAPAKAAVKSSTVSKSSGKAKAPVASKAAPAKSAPAKAVPAPSKAAAKASVPAKSIPPAKSPVTVKKGAPEPVAAKSVAIKGIPAKPTPAKPEPKSTTIARPVPKPETKPVELKPIKTSVATTVKYEPDFTKSVLDDPGQTILNAPTMRYSDAELAEFKDLIIRKLDAAKKELTYLQGLITRKDEMGGDESENRYMTMEDGSISMEREQLSQMASRQIQFIDHLEKALMRIENKTYGICRVTGKLIDKARLRAVPHATLSIEAKMGLVKKPENQNIQ